MHVPHPVHRPELLSKFGNYCFTGVDKFLGISVQDQIIATPFLDRLIYHCTTVNIKGDSSWMKDALKKKLVMPSDFEK